MVINRLETPDGYPHLYSWSHNMGTFSRKKSVNPFRFDVSRCQPRVANMEQIDAESQAVHVAARRACDAGISRVQDINGKLVGTKFDQVTDHSSYNWKISKPDLPELMIKSGLMTRDDFPAWTRPFLKNE